MNIEEKARAYDEALERAKAAIDMAADKDLVKGVATTIFPELRESEDERIRKALILHLQAFYSNEVVAPGISKEMAIAYLEKQEQKPAWSEEEMKVLDSIIDDYEKAAKSFCGYDGKIGLLKAIRDGEYDLSKQEWSEEDKEMLECVIMDVETAKENYLKSTTQVVQQGAIIADKEIAWLKSLRPQPKQMPADWTDKDKRILDDVSHLLIMLNYKDMARAYKQAIEKLIYQPHWKPNEEQMKALQNAVALTACDKELARLYNQLKKL